MFLNKIAFINLAVLNVLKKKGHCFYLEIGCDDNVTFNSISLPKKYKYGVDPRDGGNIRKTSDLFFKNNKKKLKYNKMNNILINQRFKDFLKIYKNLPIISGEKALKLIGYE